MIGLFLFVFVVQWLLLAEMTTRRGCVSFSLRSMNHEISSAGWQRWDNGGISWRRPSAGLMRELLYSCLITVLRCWVFASFFCSIFQTGGTVWGWCRAGRKGWGSVWSWESLPGAGDEAPTAGLVYEQSCIEMKSTLCRRWRLKEVRFYHCALPNESQADHEVSLITPAQTSAYFLMILIVKNEHERSW